MTQVELPQLPQLSLQRYVDLVKRRRWQLLPVSLLGLLVGGIVAFAIPRYYVAETSFEHQPIQGEFDKGVEDPFRKIVNSAKMTIPLSAGKAMESLKWPEAMVADPSKRTLAEKEVRSRIDVLDSNSQEKDREIAYIRVLYRDQDAGRSAALLNALVETWIQERVTNLRGSHESELQRANQDFTDADKTYERLLQDKKELELRYRIRADLPPAMQQQEAQKRQEQQLQQRDLLGKKQIERATLTSRIARAQELIRTLPERVKPNLADLLATAKDNKEAMALVAMLQLYKADLINLADGTRARALRERAVRLREEAVLRMLAVDIDAAGLVPNLAYVALAKQLEDDSRAFEVVDIEVTRLLAAVGDEQRLLDELAEGYRLYESKRKDLESAEDKRKDAQQRQKTQSGILAALQQRLPVQQLQKAQPPPHPTDPNILLVALIGAVLGLGVAVGLILLLDLMQGSFKTTDDVERGLGVPVLGGMSHLETDEERVSVTRGRRRTATAAFGFVALVVVVVTIYYRAPTRLPAVVRDLLTMLLGS